MKTIKTCLLGIVIGACLVGGVTFGYNKFSSQSNDKGNATTEVVKTTLSKASDLTAGKMKLEGIVQYDDQGIPVLTQGKFNLYYTATIRAGIDVKDIKINSIDNENKRIKVTIPKAKVLDTPNVEVDKTENTNFVLFDLDQKEDYTKAVKDAKENCLKRVEVDSLLELADTQSESLIRGILNTGFPEYEIQVIKTK